MSLMKKLYLFLILLIALATLCLGTPLPRSPHWIPGASGIVQLADSAGDLQFDASLKSKITAWFKSLMDKWFPDDDNEPAPEPTIDPVPEPPPEPPAPAPGEFAVNPTWTGFLWKPEGENSKRLRVLLPPEWKRDRFDFNRVQIIHGGKVLETIDPIGPGNPMPGRGDREHFSGNKKGSQYPANCTVRARTIAGEEWEWTITRPSSRNENIKCRQVEIE